MATVTRERDETGEVQTEVGTLSMLEDAPNTVMALDKATIDMQVATAKRYPRSITASLQEAEEMACMDPETAGSMHYLLPKGGGIEGPSVRLAEVFVYAWGNMRAEAGVIDEDRKYVTAMGTCFDLERNVAVRVTVKRRITDKKGQRYSDDMVASTMNAATSIALRNAVFKVVPSHYVRRIYQRAKRVSAGEGKDMAAIRSKLISFFGEMGVKPEQVYQLVGVKGLDDVGTDEIIRLRGIATAIRDGDTTVAQVFNPPKESEGAHDLDSALAGGPAMARSEDDGPATPTEAPPEDPIVREAYDKALRVATELAEAGALELGDQERLDELRDAGDFDGLVAEEERLKEKLQEADA